MSDKQNHDGVDFMAVGSHPDDVEICAGGTVAKLRSLGRSGVLVDLTDGGSGTRGSVDQRQKEARAAAELLGVERICLGLEDGWLESTRETQLKMVKAIRAYKPKVILTHYWEDEHPDHIHASRLVQEAAHKAGFKNLPGAEGEPYRCTRLFHFPGGRHVEPSFCVDVTDFWKQKLDAIGCFVSQVHTGESAKWKEKTDLSSPAFLEFLESRARFYGWRIRRRFAEPFVCRELPEIDDITEVGRSRFA